MSATCVACGGPVKPAPHERELPERAAHLRAEAARFADMAARCKADAAAIDAQIKQAAATGGHPRICTAADRFGVDAAGCQRFVTDRDLLGRWPGGGYRLDWSDPDTGGAVDEMVGHINANKAAGRARGGTGHVAAH